MNLWKVTNLIEVAMRGVLVWQAWKFWKVKQEGRGGIDAKAAKASWKYSGTYRKG